MSTKKYSVSSAAITISNVEKLRKSVHYNGRMVINPKVTDKVMTCMSMSIEEIANAGKSGMTEKDGIIRNVWNVFVSDGYGGKMSDVVGISGFAGNNRKCIERAQKGIGVCPYCFSFRNAYFTCLPAWTKNDTIFSTVKLNVGDLLLDSEKIPECRFSTHGDLNNALHGYNYMVIAFSNPKTQFTLWTKNNEYYQQAREMFAAEFGIEKPDNLRVIFSGNRLDIIPNKNGLKLLKKNGYDAYFVVYSKRAIQEKAVTEFYGHFCKCGRNSCKYNCHFCYDYFTRESWMPFSNTAVLIAEILDGERHKE